MRAAVHLSVRHPRKDIAYNVVIKEHLNVVRADEL